MNTRGFLARETCDRLLPMVPGRTMGFGRTIVPHPHLIGITTEWPKEAVVAGRLPKARPASQQTRMRADVDVAIRWGVLPPCAAYRPTRYRIGRPFFSEIARNMPARPTFPPLVRGPYISKKTRGAQSQSQSANARAGRARARIIGNADSGNSAEGEIRRSMQPSIWRGALQDSRGWG